MKMLLYTLIQVYKIRYPLRYKYICIHKYVFMQTKLYINRHRYTHKIAV